MGNSNFLFVSWKKKQGNLEKASFVFPFSTVFGLAISEAFLTYSEYKRVWCRSHYRYMSAQTDSVHVIDSSVGYIINHIGLKNEGVFGLNTFFNVRQSFSKKHCNAGAACDTCLNKAVFVGCSFGDSARS